MKTFVAVLALILLAGGVSEAGQARGVRGVGGVRGVRTNQFRSGNYGNRSVNYGYGNYRANYYNQFQLVTPVAVVAAVETDCGHAAEVVVASPVYNEVLVEKQVYVPTYVTRTNYVQYRNVRYARNSRGVHNAVNARGFRGRR